jgi:hypothetical protein
MAAGTHSIIQNYLAGNATRQPVRQKKEKENNLFRSSSTFTLLTFNDKDILFP